MTVTRDAASKCETTIVSPLILLNFYWHCCLLYCWLLAQMLNVCTGAVMP